MPDTRTVNLLSLVLVLTLVSVSFLAVGSTAAQEAVEVSDPQELHEVRADLGGDYVLVNDIDMSDVAGFDPIGDRDDGFSGGFDGDGHVVEGMTVDRPEADGVGLFGAVEDGGTVENVGLEDADVTGGENVGGIAGFNAGNVTRSYVDGEVTATEERVGGVVGWNRHGLVADSYSEAEVSGASRVGGVAGWNTGTVERTYAVGEVSGTRIAGGLVGQLGSGQQRAGTEAALRDSYWDTDTTGQSRAAGETREGLAETTVENVEGLSTDEMRGDGAAETMEALVSSANWRTTDGYPALAWEAGVFDADGVPAPGFGLFVGVASVVVASAFRLLTTAGSDR